jgi:hypothetical protein
VESGGRKSSRTAFDIIHPDDFENGYHEASDGTGDGVIVEEESTSRSELSIVGLITSVARRAPLRHPAAIPKKPTQRLDITARPTLQHAKLAGRESIDIQIGLLINVLNKHGKRVPL